jgi:hypothetical protein
MRLSPRFWNSHGDGTLLFSTIVTCELPSVLDVEADDKVQA